MILIINNALSGLQPPYLIIIMKYPLTSVWNTQKQSFLQNLRPEFSGRYGLAADPPWAFSQHSFHLTFHFAAKGVLANWKLCLSADRIDYPACLKYKMQKRKTRAKETGFFIWVYSSVQNISCWNSTLGKLLYHFKSLLKNVTLQLITKLHLHSSANF